MSKLNRTVTGRRLNLRAAIILGVGALVVTASVFAYKAYRGQHNRTLFLREANARLEAKQPQLALQYLSRHLALNPNDVDAMDLKAKVLAESARNAYQALEAMPVHTQVLGLDPENPKRQETRRRLVELNLRVGGRAQAAETLARELIRRGANDAQAHRLLATALEGVGAEGNPKALEEACREYETAEKLEPGDVDAAERLALLYRDKLQDPARALKVLDQLVVSNAKSPAKLAAAHLARSRYFLGSNQADRSDAEIALALKADPKSLDGRLMAAEAANRKGDVAEAHRQLDAVPKDARDDLRVKLVEGLVELNEQRNDEAIRSWRDGLVQTGGNSAELTWRLAQVLLDMGRTSEAEPLIAQYRRLIGGDEPNVFSRYLAGFALFKKDRPAEAITELEAIRYKAPSALAPHLDYVLGQCYERVNDTTKAIDAYRQANKSAPEWSPPWVAIANLQAASSLADAHRTLEQGLAVSPDDPRLLVNSALVLWRQQLELPAEQRSWREVERVLDRAEKAAPNSVEAALVRADYLTTRNKPADALARLEQAARVNPKSAPLWLARANLLGRLDRRADAIKTLDQAIATSAQAAFFVLRASFLLAAGHAREAHAALEEGLGRVPADQRPELWKALGDLAVKQNDPASARQSYRKWARLQPDSPEPRAALLELALGAGDDQAIRAEVDALKGIGGPQAPYWRLARAEELLRDRSGKPAAAAAELDEAARLIQEVQKSQPHSPSGYVLEGRLLEKTGQVDKAIAAYEKALGQRGGRIALAPLMALLVRERRDTDLERIRKTGPAIPPDLQRLATVQALKAGDKDRAEQMAARMVAQDPKGLEARVWQARVLNELGKPQEAEAALRRLVDENPTEAAPRIQLLLLQLSRKQTREAADTIEQIRAKVKSDRPELLWAQAYRLAGKLKEADASYRAALARWPDDVAVLSAAADFFEATGKKADLETALRHLHKADPALGWATRKLALLLANRDGDLAAWDEALALVGPTARPDDTPDDRLARANVYARGATARHRQQAIVILEELASELPNAIAVHELLARLQRDAGQLEPARTHAAKAAAGEAASPDAILLYASILLGEKDLDEAHRQLERLVAIDRNSLAVAELGARILAARGRPRDASADLERAYDAHAQSAEALTVGEKMIGLLLQLGQPDAAERVARKVGALGAQGALVEGLFLAGRGRLDDAAARFEDTAKKGDAAGAGTAALMLASAPSADPRWLPMADRFLALALKEHPDSIDALQKMARLRYLQGRFADQVALFQTILSRKPSDYTFLNDMAWTLSEDLGQPEKGLERADQVLKLVGWQANFLDTRGVILTRLGKFDDAIKDLEAATAALPSGPLYYHLARAYEKKGRNDDFHKARDQARKAGLRPEQLQPSERADWARIMEK